MILFFGTREVKQNDHQTPPRTAHCPVCGRQVILQPRSGQFYFHVFWIPLLPLGETHHYLQCPTCKTRYEHWPSNIPRTTPPKLPRN